jgi:nitrite reductase/ring-hydroxylating ferredoxin subunit
VPIVVFRRNGRLSALANRCTHRGGPLDEGELTEEGIVCPWHGSCFRIEDGAILRGPATAPQPSFEVRQHAGKIEVRAKDRDG